MVQFLRFCKSDRERKSIESFLFRYFLGYRKMPTRLSRAQRRKLLAPIDVEEVFTFLSERARAPSTSPQLRTYAHLIWSALVSEIGNVFGRFTANAKTRSVFRSFIKHHYKSFDTIVSFNYDTIFETSLQGGKAHYTCVDCGGNAVSVLKPHGSVNWSAGTDGSIKVETSPRKSVIVAPTHLKFVSTSSDVDDDVDRSLDGYLDQSEQIRQIWEQMEERMRGARALVFIGYSFPQADLYFSSVLRSVLADRKTTPDIVIVNPDAVAIAEKLKSRFALARVLSYFDFVQFTQAKRIVVLSQLNASDG